MEVIGERMTKAENTNPKRVALKHCSVNIVKGLQKEKDQISQTPMNSKKPQTSSTSRSKMLI